MLLAVSALGAVDTSRASAAACGGGRKEGYPVPKWWPEVRRLIKANRSYFPRGISIPFLGAWIERESDGRYNLTSRSDEVGFFQLHPSELEGMVGAASVAAAMDEIRSSPTASMRWGGRYLSGYDKRLVAEGIPRGGELYYGLLKAMHWNPPKAIRWVKHVNYALGGNWPSNYGAFIQIASEIQAGHRPWDPNVKRVDQLPSCSPFQLLARVPTFVTPADSAGPTAVSLLQLTQPLPFLTVPSWDVVFRSLHRPSMSSLLGSQVFNLTPSVWDRRRPIFTSPVPLPNKAQSGYTSPRPKYNRRHGALDFDVPVGTDIFAIADGVVRRARDVTGEGTGRGVFIEIDHQLAGYPIMSRYLHLAKAFVRDGEIVRRGQRIAASGASDANWPHLHLDVIIPDELRSWYTTRFGPPPGGAWVTSQAGTHLPLEGLVPTAVGVGADTPLYRNNRSPSTAGRFAFAGVSALALFGLAALIKLKG